MRYTEVLSKIAVGSAEQAAVIQSPEFKTVFNKFLKGDGKSYMDNVSPGEIMRTALGATAGGGIGWLLSRLLHKKPKSWRTALYILGSAAAGGYGTHWYLNNPDASGSTIAQRLRREYALTDPAVQKRIKDIQQNKPTVPAVPTGGVNDKDVPGSDAVANAIGKGSDVVFGKDNPITPVAAEFSRDPIKVGEVLPQSVEEWTRLGATTGTGLTAGILYNLFDNYIHKNSLTAKIEDMNHWDNLYRSGSLPQPSKRMTGPRSMTFEINGGTRRFIDVPATTTKFDRVVNIFNSPRNWLRQRRINKGVRLQATDITDRPFRSVGTMGIFRSNKVNGTKFVLDAGTNAPVGHRFTANPEAFAGFDPKSLRYRTLRGLRSVGGGVTGLMAGLLLNAADRAADTDKYIREQQLLLEKPITK